MSNKMWEIHDNVLTLAERQLLYNAAINSIYAFGWGDTDLPNSEKYIHSKWSLEDVNATGLLDNKKLKVILRERGLDTQNIREAVVNV